LNPRGNFRRDERRESQSADDADKEEEKNVLLKSKTGAAVNGVLNGKTRRQKPAYNLHNLRSDTLLSELFPERRFVRGKNFFFKAEKKEGDPGQPEKVIALKGYLN